MTRTLNAAADIGGDGSTIKKAGTYHCAITHAADGESTKGKPISGFCALLTVLAGTNKDEVENEFHLTLFDPDLSQKEAAQEWANKKQTAYAIAINQLDPSKLGEPVTVAYENAAGQQLIITLDENEYEGKKSLQLAYANIYHVDDPRAKDFPKSKDALALIGQEFRKPAEYFKPLTDKTGGGKKSPPKITNADLADL